MKFQIHKEMVKTASLNELKASDLDITLDNI